MEAGAIDDYTYLWWDVRPHPNLGTVEIRVFDQQTRLEHTVALRRADRCRSPTGSAALFDDGEPLVEVPTELVDDNKVRAALRGVEGELVDFPRRRSVPAAGDGPPPARRAARGRRGARLRDGARGHRGR